MYLEGSGLKDHVVVKLIIKYRASQRQAKLLALYVIKKYILYIIFNNSEMHNICFANLYTR